MSNHMIATRFLNNVPVGAPLMAQAPDGTRLVGTYRGGAGEAIMMAVPALTYSTDENGEVQLVREVAVYSDCEFFVSEQAHCEFAVSD